MDQLGFLVYFSREGNSACLVAHLGSLVCFFRPEKSVYLMDQLESLVCLSPEREKKSACLVDQRGPLVGFLRGGNPLCLMDPRRSLVWISWEGVSVCLMNQPEFRCLLVRPALLDYFSPEIRFACLKLYSSYCVVYQPQRLCLSETLSAMTRVSLSDHETVPVPPTWFGEPRAVQPSCLRPRTPLVLPSPPLPLSTSSQDEARTLRSGCFLRRYFCARGCRRRAPRMRGG